MSIPVRTAASLALILTWGIGATAAAQSKDPQSSATTKEATAEAVDHAQEARRAAADARQAAEAAADVRDEGALTAEGAQDAAHKARVAHEAAINAQKAANAAAGAATQAGAAHSATQGGTAQPRAAAVESVQARNAADRAAASASMAADVAAEAALDAQDATLALPTRPAPALPAVSPAAGAVPLNFDAWDVDRDDALSPAELQTHAVLSAQLPSLDRDGDGRLSRDELAGWL